MCWRATSASVILSVERSCTSRAASVAALTLRSHPIASLQSVWRESFAATVPWPGLLSRRGMSVHCSMLGHQGCTTTCHRLECATWRRPPRPGASTSSSRTRSRTATVVPGPRVSPCLLRRIAETYATHSSKVFDSLRPCHAGRDVRQSELLAGLHRPPRALADHEPVPVFKAEQVWRASVVYPVMANSISGTLVARH